MAVAGVGVGEVGTEEPLFPMPWSSTAGAVMCSVLCAF